MKTEKGSNPRAPLSGAGEMRAVQRGASICECRKALVWVKAWFRKLEYGTDYRDPLRQLRERYHAPVHATIDAALAEPCQQYQDAMVAHRWFATEFGEIMNGRDFAVKTEMASRILADLRNVTAAPATDSNSHRVDDLAGAALPDEKGRNQDENASSLQPELGGGE